MLLRAEPAELDLPPPSLTEEDFIKTARDRYTSAINYDQHDRDEAIKDVDFLGGDQWDERSKRIRETLKRPILSWPRLHKFVDQVANDQRENKPSIRTAPGDGTPKQTSEVFQGRIRQIEYESDADIAYDQSAEQQIGCGRAFYRVTTEWNKKPGKRFKQVIKLKPIENQFSVTYDPLAKEYDRNDAEFLFVDSLLSKGQYKKQYPKAKVSQNDFFAGTTSSENPAPEWFNIGQNKDCVRVAEYWLKEYSEVTICQLANGDECTLQDCPEGAIVINRRSDYDCKIMQYVIDGLQILSETEWLGSCFPIVPVWGRQEVVRGRRRNISLIRYAHDAQKLVNLYVSNIAEQVAMMPKTPFIGYEGVFDEHEDEWEEVNNIPKAYLTVKPVRGPNGELLPIPVRVREEPPIQALSIGLGQAIDAMKAACGIYDSSLGQAPPDASGLAIQRRNTESDLGNFHFADNQSRSRKYCGRILIELIKKLDAGEDKITIRHVDGKTSTVHLNKQTQHSDGTSVTHNLGEAEIEPHIFTGPSYTSARQEASAAYAQIAQSDKNFMQIAGDKYFRALDFPGADEIADRYEKMLPAQLQNPTDPSQLQGKVQQLSQLVQQLSTTVHTLQDEIDTKKLELSSKERIAAMQEETKRQNIQAQVTIAEANLGVKSALGQLAEETDAIKHSMDHMQTQIDSSRSADEAEFNSLLQHYSAMGAGAPDGSDQPPTDNGGGQ